MKGCCSGILFVIEKIPEKQILSFRVDPVEKVRVASSESLPIYLTVIVVRQDTSLSYYIKILLNSLSTRDENLQTASIMIRWLIMSHLI